jgi:hypothetical protein
MYTCHAISVKWHAIYLLSVYRAAICASFLRKHYELLALASWLAHHSCSTRPLEAVAPPPRFSRFLFWCIEYMCCATRGTVVPSRSMHPGAPEPAVLPRGLRAGGGLRRAPDGVVVGAVQLHQPRLGMDAAVILTPLYILCGESLVRYTGRY